MSVQLFRLKNVPEDEAQDIRELLIKNNIDHYETPPGNWGISMPAIWLSNEEQLEYAKSLIDNYQSERSANHRNQHEQHKTIVRGFLENPVQFVLYIAFAVVILYFSIKPFLNFGQ